jgi:hypothetical protein
VQGSAAQVTLYILARWQFWTEADRPPIRALFAVWVLGFCSARSAAARVAQLVEHAIENRSVVSSILTLGTISPLWSSFLDCYP